MSDWMSRWVLFEKSAQKATRFVTTEDLVYHTLISLKYHFLYVVTPKVACSTIKKLLIEAEYEGKVDLYGDASYIHYKEFSPLLTAQQVGDFNTFVQRDDIFKFCFVRNPYTRLLSCYLDKILKGKPESITIMIESGYSKYSDHILSFSEFVDAIVEEPVRHMNPHWRTQYYTTFQEGVAFDFIGRFEKLETDLRYAMKQCGIDFDHYYQPQKGHATGASQKLEEYYTPELQEKVIRKFKIDFEYFGYSEELP